MLRVSDILHLLAIAGCLSSTGHECVAVEYYVTPTSPPNPSCPSDHPCYTLDQYNQNASQFFTEKGNLTLIFLDGIHNLSKHLLINNFDNVILAVNTNHFHNTEITKDTPTATFRFVQRSHLELNNVVHLQIENVQFVAVTSKKFVTSDISISNTQTIAIQGVDLQYVMLSISYIGPRKVFPVISGNQQMELYKKAFKPLLAVVNVQHCKFSGSSIRLKVASQGSVVSFEGGNQTRSFANLTIRDSNITNTVYSSRHYRGMLSISLYSGWLANVTISNSNLIGGPANGVHIQVEKGNTILDVHIEKSTVMHHKYSAMFINHKSSGSAKVNLERCMIYGNGHGAVINVNKRYTGSTSVFSMNHTTISRNNINGLLLSTSSTNLLKVDIEGSNISHNKITGLILKGTFCINIYNTTIAFNQNGGMFIDILGQAGCNGSQILLQNCTIADNILTSTANRQTGIKTSAPGISFWSEEESTSTVTIKNVMFMRNNDHSLQPINLQLLNLKRVIIQDCEFKDNHGSPIQVHYSTVTLSGNLLFKGNLAFRGGGFSLLDSTILIQNNTNISFINNSATNVGGAIFIHELPFVFKTKSIDQCFYQLPDVRNISDLSTLISSLNFYNNTSENGGDDIYGASLIDWCSVTDGSEVRSKGATKLFHFHTHPKGYSSSISSDPKRVCLCDEYGTPQCANISHIFLNQTRYPGESFNLSLVLVGDEFGTVSGTVYATLLKQEHSEYKLDPIQRSQEVGFKKCNDVEYSIHSTRNEETLVLTAEKASIELYGNAKKVKSYINDSKNQSGVIPPGLLLTPVFVNVTLEVCPLGFQLENNTLSCQCISTLTKAGIENCEISNHTGLIHRSGTVWIMASYNGNESNGVVVHNSCPYHYCKEQDVPTDLRYPDTQCALDHSGILCGGCLPNLSLALGSNQCLPCSNNNHLALLVFFITAGFMLVIFIKVLDLTVAKGTINGLIFYANIVWAYQSILFPPQDNTNLALQFLRVFLAWLNLDFGIETCFIEGLTAYWKTWLQFVFPIYIWLIAGFIIVTSNYFKLATKLFGNNSVPVLATLFLLSYAKLVRTIITVLGRAFLHYPDHKSVVWTFDGNLPYFGLEHTFLFVAALVALLFLWLPFVSTLLLVPWLKRKSHLKPLHWINRWKPFYDAYYGPLKDKHHYWVGFLLIVRGVLLVLFSLTSATAPDINILAMILTPSVLLLYTSHIGNVYKNRLLSLFENSFFVNMIFLGSGILYTGAFKGSKGTILQISVWFAFAQFACILLFYVWCSLKLGKKCLGKRHNSETNQEQRRINTDRDEHDQLRESLLESVVQE